MNKKLTFIFLGIIVFLSICFRFFKLGTFPKAITWDEAAVGYNAYTILNWGKDEWGNKFPLVFKSFEDDKNPIHIYSTVPFVAVLGLNEFATRAPASFFGVLNVIVIFFLARRLFKSDLAGLLSSLFLAVSPFAIQFSRFNHELNFAIFFFLAGTLFFYKGLQKKKYFLLLSFLFFGIDLLTYHSAKIITPILIILLVSLNFKKLIKTGNYFIWSGVIYVFFVCILFLEPGLLGGARLEQNLIQEREIEETVLYQETGNKTYSTIELVFKRYLEYFKPQFLFVSGDPIQRHSIQAVGTFYWLDLPFLIIGFIVLLFELVKKKNRQMFFILVWMFIAPLPAAASSRFTHAPRAMFMMGSWTVVSAFGAYTLINLLKNKYLKIIFGSLIIIFSGVFVYRYFYEYFGNYADRYAVEWRYGMKEAVDIAKSDGFKEVYMTDCFMQPYIFFLYYLKTPLPEFLDSVYYNRDLVKRPSNLVVSFGKYRFAWDEYHSEPIPGILYIVKPSVYDGLYQKISFDTVKLIKYPNKIDALYAVTAK